MAATFAKSSSPNAANEMQHRTRTKLKTRKRITVFGYINIPRPRGVAQETCTWTNLLKREDRQDRKGTKELLARDAEVGRDLFGWDKRDNAEREKFDVRNVKSKTYVGKFYILFQ